MTAPTFQIFGMCQALKRLGYDVSLLTFVGIQDLSIPSEGIFRHYGISKQFPLHRLPLRGVQRLLNNVRLGQQFAGLVSAFCAWKFGSHVVYTRHSAAAYYALRLGISVIYETHPFPCGEEKYWDDKEYESKLLRLVHYPEFLVFVTLSPYVARTYIDLGIPKSKVIVQPSGIDFERFADISTKSRARKQLQLPPNRDIVVYAGRFSNLKGTKLLFRIARAMPDVLFILLGYWGEKKLEDDLCRYHSYPNVQLRGTVTATELPLWLNCADVLILPTLASEPSSQWTSPLKLFEYMASGRPIVASNLPNIASVVKSGESALLVDNDSLDDYVAAIRFLLNNTAEAQQIALRARSLCRNYTWERRVEKILSQSGVTEKWKNQFNW